MKSFYNESPAGPVHGAQLVSDPASYICTRARVAVYDALSSAPYVEEVGPAPVKEYIESLAIRVYELARDRGGRIPYTVVREVAENLIHADFNEPVVSVLDDGHTIRFSDQGPGIADKARALEPGFTTATGPMKEVIRGVGSGLPLVREFLSVSGGHLAIEDNLSAGAVVTLTTGKGRVTTAERSAIPTPATTSFPVPEAPVLELEEPLSPSAARPHLTTRQKQVLAVVLEVGSAGPSVVSRELGVGLSTAYRDLASLEDLGLIAAEGGKRALTHEGFALLGTMTTTTREG